MVRCSGCPNVLRVSDKISVGYPVQKKDKKMFPREKDGLWRFFEDFRGK